MFENVLRDEETMPVLNRMLGGVSAVHGLRAEYSDARSQPAAGGASAHPRLAWTCTLVPDLALSRHRPRPERPRRCRADGYALSCRPRVIGPNSLLNS
jgi:hypothetical protein